MKFEGKLVSKDLINPRLGILKFKLDQDLEFTPGQFCNIKVGEGLMRPYSMVSKPGKNPVEFYVKSYPDGSVADKILALEEGDLAEISGPFGSFQLRENDNKKYFICAGTGIAPVVCMARQLNGNTPETLFLHGASHVEELGYREELEKMDTADGFNYLPTISRPGQNPDWEGETGRVEEFLHHCTDAEAEVYVCGPPPMVVNVTEILSEKGFSEERILTEQYY